MLAALVCMVLLIVDNGEAVITSATVGSKLRFYQPTFLMVDELMELRDRYSCAEKMFCLMETDLPHEEHNPLKYYSRFLTNTHGDFDDVAFREVYTLTKKFPKLNTIIDSIKFGQHANNSLQCNFRYSTCNVTESEILAEVNAFSDDSITQYGFPPQNHGVIGKRADGCWWGGLGCAAVGGACAICAASTALTCGAACAPQVGAACSGFGLGCLFGK